MERLVFGNLDLDFLEFGFLEFGNDDIARSVPIVMAAVSRMELIVLVNVFITS